MKRIFVFTLVLFLISLGAQAKDNLFLFSVDRSNQQAVYEHSVFEQLQEAVKQKDSERLKTLLKKSDSRIWTKKDRHGNNLFHLCSDVKTFSMLHMYLASVREEMLSEKNKAGETPWMSYIVYGKEDIFLTYFPKSTLYTRLQQISFELENAVGLNYQNALTQKDAILKECSSAGGQTLWQRADLMCKGLSCGAKGHASYTYSANTAPGMNKPSSTKNKMEQVRDLIEEVAPFLVR
ncbi:MAG: hypothetical protein IJ311_03910 [Elusimicrobiaceae bacterium]|nr:hypothetical protein [Elusimicrobiaceae bacterium]